MDCLPLKFLEFSPVEQSQSSIPFNSRSTTYNKTNLNCWIFPNKKKNLMNFCLFPSAHFSHPFFPNSFLRLKQRWICLLVHQQWCSSSILLYFPSSFLLTFSVYIFWCCLRLLSISFLFFNKCFPFLVRRC